MHFELKIKYTVITCRCMTWFVIKYSWSCPEVQKCWWLKWDFLYQSITKCSLLMEESILKTFLKHLWLHTHTQTNGNVSIFFHLIYINLKIYCTYIRKFYVYSKINVTIYPLDFNYQWQISMLTDIKKNALWINELSTMICFFMSHI